MAQIYRVGQIIEPYSVTGGSGWKLEVVTSTDRELKVKMIYPSNYTQNYLAGSVENMTPATNASYNGKIISITESRRVILRATNPSGGTAETKWIKPWSWFGNKRGNDLYYGGGATRFVSGAAPKTPDSDVLTGLKYSDYSPSQWAYVPGTFKWGNTEADANWKGWTYSKGAFHDGTVNDYARPITYQIKSKGSTAVQHTARFEVTFTPYNEPPKPVPEPEPEPPEEVAPPDIALYDGLNGNAEISSYYERETSVQVNWMQMSDCNYRVENATFEGRPYSITNGKTLTQFGTYEVTVTAIKKADSSKTASVSATIIIADMRTPDSVVKDGLNNYEQIGPDPTTYTRPSAVKAVWDMDTSAFNYSVSSGTYMDIDGNARSFPVSNGTLFTEYGTYSFMVSAMNKNNQSISVDYPCTIVVEDITPPPDFTIYDARDMTVYTEDTIPVFVTDRVPIIDMPPRCVAHMVTLNFQPHMLGSVVSEDGVYVVSVTIRKTTNNMLLTKVGKFEIDTKPPDPPLIDIGDNMRYQGENYGLVRKLINNINYKVYTEQLALGVVIDDLKIWYKPQLYADWQPYTPLNAVGMFANQGVYKISARTYKPRNKMYSESYTILQVYRKVKRSWLITLDPNVLTYRTTATVNIIDDPFLKYMYKLNNGDWQWYRDPVKIYENGTMYFKSLDGDDDFESEIAFKVIDIIDIHPPTEAEIGGVNEGDVVNTPVIPFIVP